MSRHAVPGRRATAHGRLFDALLDDGSRLDEQMLAERVGWALALVEEMAYQVLAEHWNSIDVASTTGIGPDGRLLPTFAYKCLERLSWSPRLPTDVHVCSRMQRMAGELAGRAMRAGAVRAMVIRAILAGYPLQTPEQRARTRALLPEGTSWTWVRNMCRRVQRYAHEHGGVLPTSLFDMEPGAKIGAVLTLAVADNQFCTFNPTSAGQYYLRLLLPTRARPTSREDWVCVIVRVHLTKVLRGLPGLPTLRLDQGRILADVPLQRLAPAMASKHRMALGLDWGVSRLFVGSVLRLEVHAGKPLITTDGRFLQANVRGLQEHYHLVRLNYEHVRTRLFHLQRLEEGQHERGRLLDPRRHANIGVLTQEAIRLAHHMRWLNREMAWLAARWAVEQAKAVGATLIVIEDLDDLEPTHLDKRRRTRVSAQVRGLVQANLEHLAAGEGIRVLMVPPRDTSARCPRCLVKLRHVPSPDQPTRAGYAWAHCRACGFDADRDHSASERIGQRGLLLAWAEENATLAELRGGVAQPLDQPVCRRVQQRAECWRLPQLRGRKWLPHTPHTTNVAPILTAPSSASARSDPPNSQQPRRACRAGTPPLSEPPAGHRSAGPGTAVPSPDGAVCQSRTNTASPLWRTRALAAGPLDGTRYALRTRARFSPVRRCGVGISLSPASPSTSPSTEL